jgi:HD domain
MDSGQRQLLAAMPLHAITSTYGENGLRERFAAEIAELPAGDQRRLNRALELAARLHADDRREREPYLNHLLRVAIRIMSHYGVRDTDVVCAALLHDAVEDHAAELAGAAGAGAAGVAGGGVAGVAGVTGGGVAGAAGVAGGGVAGVAGVTDGVGVAGGGGGGAARRDAALDALAAEVGARVAELVDAVTNPEYAPDRDAHEQYREHVADSLRRCPWARVIKASDFADNGAGLIHITGPRLRKLAGKYAPLVPVLREFITEPDTPLDGPARQRILAQLDRAAARFAAVLGAHE